MRERDELAWAQTAVLSLLGLAAWVATLLGGHVVACEHRHPSSLVLKAVLTGRGCAIALSLLFVGGGVNDPGLLIASTGTILMLVLVAGIDLWLRISKGGTPRSTSEETVADLLGPWE